MGRKASKDTRDEEYEDEWDDDDDDLVQPNREKRTRSRLSTTLAVEAIDEKSPIRKMGRGNKQPQKSKTKAQKISESISDENKSPVKQETREGQCRTGLLPFKDVTNGVNNKAEKDNKSEQRESPVLKSCPRVGLHNEGQTCYVNAVVQTLVHVPELRSALENSTVRWDTDVLLALQTVIMDMKGGVIGPMSLYEFNTHMRFAPTVAGDPSEALLVTLQRLRYEVRDDDFLKQVIGGVLTEEINGTVLFDVLDLPVGGHSSLTSLLSSKLGNIKITAFPKVLILHLSRYVVRNRRSSKIEDTILYDEVLDMAPFSMRDDQSLRYDLIGVIAHVGNQTGGHYIAYLKEGDKSYCFDDEEVTQCNASELKSLKRIKRRDGSEIEFTATMLIYRLREGIDEVAVEEGDWEDMPVDINGTDEVPSNKGDQKPVNKTKSTRQRSYTMEERQRAIVIGRQGGPQHAARECKIPAPTLTKWKKKDEAINGPWFDAHRWIEEDKQKAVILGRKIGAVQAGKQCGIPFQAINRWRKKDEKRNGKWCKHPSLRKGRNITSSQKQNIIAVGRNFGVNYVAKKFQMAKGTVSCWKKKDTVPWYVVPNAQCSRYSPSQRAEAIAVGRKNGSYYVSRKCNIPIDTVKVWRRKDERLNGPWMKCKRERKKYMTIESKLRMLQEHESKPQTDTLTRLEREILKHKLDDLRMQRLELIEIQDLLRNGDGLLAIQRHPTHIQSIYASMYLQNSDKPGSYIVGSVKEFAVRNGLPPMFRCDMCSLTFYDVKKLNQHRNRHNSVGVQFVPFDHSVDIDQVPGYADFKLRIDKRCNSTLRKIDRLRYKGYLILVVHNEELDGGTSTLDDTPHFSRASLQRLIEDDKKHVLWFDAGVLEYHGNEYDEGPDHSAYRTHRLTWETSPTVRDIIADLKGEGYVIGAAYFDDSSTMGIWEAFIQNVTFHRHMQNHQGFVEDNTDLRPSYKLSTVPFSNLRDNSTEGYETKLDEMFDALNEWGNPIFNFETQATEGYYLNAKFNGTFHILPELRKIIPDIRGPIVHQQRKGRLPKKKGWEPVADDRLECKMCGNRYDSKDSMEAHMDYEHKTGTFKLSDPDARSKFKAAIEKKVDMAKERKDDREFWVYFLLFPLEELDQLESGLATLDEESHFSVNTLRGFYTGDGKTTLGLYVGAATNPSRTLPMSKYHLDPLLHKLSPNMREIVQNRRGEGYAVAFLQCSSFDIMMLQESSAQMMIKILYEQNLLGNRNDKVLFQPLFKISTKPIAGLKKVESTSSEYEDMLKCMYPILCQLDVNLFDMNPSLNVREAVNYPCFQFNVPLEVNFTKLIVDGTTVMDVVVQMDDDDIGAEEDCLSENEEEDDEDVSDVSDGEEVDTDELCDDDSSDDSESDEDDQSESEEVKGHLRK